jgi:hypothetical protein
MNLFTNAHNDMCYYRLIIRIREGIIHITHIRFQIIYRWFWLKPKSLNPEILRVYPQQVCKPPHYGGGLEGAPAGEGKVRVVVRVNSL